MSEPRPIRDRLRSFDDLASVGDDVLRQLASRVHIIDLAYAFGTADEALKERLLRSVRPGLAEEIQSAIKTVEAERDRFPGGEQIRTARARVLELARTAVLEES